MFEGRALSEVTYAEFERFLQEANEEGTRLDYKERWNPAKAAQVISSFANTAGGLLVVGVDEKRDPNNSKIKLKIPDPVNVLGLEPKDWEASASGAVRSRTRPGLVPEAKALEIPNHPNGHVVLLVRVEESLEAPHEVHATSTPEILVRRGDNTESAGLDDVERMIYRRDRVRDADLEPLVPEFFEGSIGPEEQLDAWPQGYPVPTVAIALRPRRAVGLHLDFSVELDREIQHLAYNHSITQYETLRPTSSGVVVRDRPAGTPSMVAEVRADGTVLAARALKVTPQADTDTSGGMESNVVQGSVRFVEVAELLVNAAGFAASCHGLAGRTGEEIEACLGFSHCLGHSLEFPDWSGYDTPSSGIFGEQPGFGKRSPYASAVLAPNPSTGDVPKADLLSLLRDASRFFGASASDEFLARYVR
jgi:Putative DNA-binding domain